MPSQVIVREPENENEALEYFKICSHALLVPPSDAEPWMQREGWQNARIALVDGQIAGGISVQDMGQIIAGTSIPCGVVRAVGVAPHFRASGVAKQFLKYSLEELRAKGSPIAMLYPATQKVYRAVGFEQAGYYFEFDLSIDDLVHVRSELPITEVSIDDPRIRSLYTQSALRQNGLFDRSEWCWRRVLHPLRTLDLRAYLFGEPEHPEGYVVMFSKAGEKDRYGSLNIRDRGLLTPAAHRSVLALAAQHRSVVDRLIFAAGPNDALLGRLPNQRFDVLRSERWMLRIVDPKKALELRHYPKCVSGEIHLQIEDDLLQPHTYRCVMKIRDGRATVEEGGNANLTIDTRGLAGMYTGFFSATDVVDLGYAQRECGDELNTLQTAFSTSVPWLTEII